MSAGWSVVGILTSTRQVGQGHFQECAGVIQCRSHSERPTIFGRVERPAGAFASGGNSCSTVSSPHGHHAIRPQICTKSGLYSTAFASEKQACVRNNNGKPLGWRLPVVDTWVLFSELTTRSSIVPSRSRFRDPHLPQKPIVLVSPGLPSGPPGKPTIGADRPHQNSAGIVMAGIVLVTVAV